MDPLAVFSPAAKAWFEGAFAEPTPAQTLGWPAIATGGDVLIQAPTGSGKTLTAFLYAIDRVNASPGEGLRVLYVSPLKALNYDIERNLRGPLAGLGSSLRVGVRTGDTAAKERRELIRHPPDILITTPESLFLMLTSAARESLRSVETLILDEVHAVAGTKRGAHLALSVERLQRLIGVPIQRIGLSATQRPLEEIGRFVSGGRPIQLVDAGTRKELDLQVVVPVDDLRELGSTAALAHPLLSEGQVTDGTSERGVASIWPSMYPELLALVEAHRSTIVFVNNRRLAARLALRLNELSEREIARAHHGSLAREAAVVGPRDLALGQLVEAEGEARGEAAVVDEDDRRAVRLDQSEQLGIHRRPDRGDAAFRSAVGHLALAEQWVRERRGRAELAQIVDRYDDLEVELLARAGVDELNRPSPGDEAADLFERPLRRGEADPLD